MSKCLPTLKKPSPSGNKFFDISCMKSYRLHNTALHIFTSVRRYFCFTIFAKRESCSCGKKLRLYLEYKIDSIADDRIPIHSNVVHVLNKAKQSLRETRGFQGFGNSSSLLCRFWQVVNVVWSLARVV